MKTMRFSSFLSLLGCVAVLAMAACAVRHTLPTGALSSPRPVPAEATTFCLVDGCFEPWADALRPTDLHREVERQLTLRGYRSLDYGPGLQPDLLVYCSVYERPLRLLWINALLQTGTPQGHRQTLRAGSVVIEFFDTRLRRVTWNGYADGLRDGEWSADERLLPRAAQTILDEYHKVAPGVSASRETASVGRGVKRRLRRNDVRRPVQGPRPLRPRGFLRKNARTLGKVRAEGEGLTMTSVDKGSRNCGSSTRCRIASHQR